MGSCHEKPSAVGESLLITICRMYSVRRRGSLDPDELAASLHDYVVVDVRDRSGWSGGHIPGSIHVPITNLDSDVIGDDKRSPLAVLADDDRQAEVAVGRIETAVDAALGEKIDAFAELRIEIKDQARIEESVALVEYWV